MSLEEFAEQASEEVEGTEPKKNSGGGYFFTFDSGNGVTSYASVSGSESFAAIIVTTGEHKDLDGIIGSLEGE